MKLGQVIHGEIQRLMDEDGVSGAELARRMKCSRVNAHLMVQKTNNFKANSIDKIAKALGAVVEFRLVKRPSKNGRKIK